MHVGVPCPAFTQSRAAQPHSPSQQEPEQLPPGAWNAAGSGSIHPLFAGPLHINYIHTCMYKARLALITTACADDPMFSRLSQVSRHFLRPLPNLAHSSAAARGTAVASTMASGVTASERASRKIQTAACLIIGDEVLGGKAGCKIVCVDCRR